MFFLEKFLASKAVAESAHWFSNHIVATANALGIGAPQMERDDFPDRVQRFHECYAELIKQFLDESPPRYANQYKYIEQTFLTFPPVAVGEFNKSTIVELCTQYFVSEFAERCESLASKGDARGVAAMSELRSKVDAIFLASGVNELSNILEKWEILGTNIESVFDQAENLADSDQFHKLTDGCESDRRQVLSEWHILNLAILQIASRDAVPNANQAYNDSTEVALGLYAKLMERAGLETKENSEPKLHSYLELAPNEESWTKIRYKWVGEFLTALEMYDTSQRTHAELRLARLVDEQYNLLRKIFVLLRVRIAELGR